MDDKGECFERVDKRGRFVRKKGERIESPSRRRKAATVDIELMTLEHNLLRILAMTFAPSLKETNAAEREETAVKKLWCGIAKIFLQNSSMVWII